MRLGSERSILKTICDKEVVTFARLLTLVKSTHWCVLSPTSGSLHR